jgi:ABC-type multidrug transport system fused ATPase/permease subunit
MRAAFVSVNFFSLLCEGTTPVTATLLGDIMRYGSPIFYLSIYGPVPFGYILVWVDSRSILTRRILNTNGQQVRMDEPQANFEANRQDVAAEARAGASSNDVRRLLHDDLTEAFEGNRVFADVSYGVPRDAVFVILGPNGDGKTTTFNTIGMPI